MSRKHSSFPQSNNRIAQVLMPIMVACAWFAALGLAAKQAPADFTLEVGNTWVFATDYTSTFDQSSGWNPGPAITTGSWLYDFNGGVGFAEVTSTSLYASINTTAGTSPLGIDGYAFAEAAMNVTVDSPTDILVEWDFSGEQYLFDNGDTSSLVVGNLLVLENLGDGLVGSQQLTLLPGEEYFLFVRAKTDFDGSAIASITIIPAPGALALLMLAGVSGSRRRRA